jgi:hypothetical protein
MRISVIMMNFIAWYLIEFELIEYWKNPMDKLVVKFALSTLAVLMLLSYMTAVLKPPTTIPEQPDKEKLAKESCWKCQQQKA